jgi:hypothetical protein
MEGELTRPREAAIANYALVLTFIAAKYLYPEIQFKPQAQDDEKCQPGHAANGIACNGRDEQQEYN